MDLSTISLSKLRLAFVYSYIHVSNSFIPTLLDEFLPIFNIIMHTGTYLAKLLFN